MEKHFLLKDKELFRGMKRDELAKRAGVERSTLFNILRGYTTTPKTAEKIAAALDMKVGQVFDDVTENKGLSGASTNKLKLNLSAIFTAAVKKEIMRRNPCRLATPPKVDTPPASYLNEEQCKEFLSLLRERGDFQLEVICNLFVASGIRAGELCALYWEDLNLETGILHIRHTLAKVGEEYIRQAPKTQESVRYILLPAYILELLKRHKTEQAKASLKAAEWKNTELLFTNQTGGFLLGTNLNARLKRVIRGTDLPQDLHIHSLRNTFASLLINSNVAARVIADRYDAIGIEDIRVKAMAKRKKGGKFSFGKSVADNGWNLFTNILEYKLAWEGKQLVRIDKWYPSSQLCHVCGYQNNETKDLSVREWDCPKCGSHHNRDKNAAINIREEARRISA